MCVCVLIKTIKINKYHNFNKLLLNINAIYHNDKSLFSLSLLCVSYNNNKQKMTNIMHKYIHLYKK